MARVTDPAGLRVVASDQPPAELSEDHRILLRDRGVSDEQIARRGHYSITPGDARRNGNSTTPSAEMQLRNLGFSASQASVAKHGPVLVIPWHNASGEFTNYQIRPSMPRVEIRNRKERPRKYEFPLGSAAQADIGSGSKRLEDMSAAIYITENGPPSTRRSNVAAQHGLSFEATEGAVRHTGGPQ